MFGLALDRVIMRVVQTVSVAPLAKSASATRRDQQSLSDLTDAELRTRIAGLLNNTTRLSEPPLLVRWLRGFLTIIGFGHVDDAQLQAVGALCEAFRRAPADLPGPGPGGAALYNEQIIAALALLHGCVVQMDTGEGKTYAILPAAACLARKHGKVFIVCANEYLAERDATRTRRFWDFIELRVALFLSGSPDDELSGDIIYTTLNALIFRVMNEDIAWVKPAYSTGFGAIIVDEADAVLIDNAFQTYAIVALLTAKAFEWPLAIEAAKQLVNEQHIIEDYSQMTATLTVLGENALRTFLLSSNIAADRLLEMRHATELAYVATRMAREDTHYINENGRIIYIDPKLGIPLPQSNPPWLIPLLAMHGREPTMSVAIDKVWATTILSRFEHVCGLSGTVRDNAIEYIISFKLLPVEVNPRRRRHGIEMPDVVFRTKDEALTYAMEQIQSELNNNRPILVGTQNITDAERLFEQVAPTLDPGVTVDLLTAKNDHDAAEFFGRAGASRTLTIATQFAGRGVDIRLTDEARAAGGLFLIGLGRNPTARHDRQFLGRAGRQGDPFGAEFVMSLDDDLFRIFGVRRLNQMLVGLGLKPNEAIIHPWIDRAIRAAQAKILRKDWLNRWHSLLASDIDAEARRRILRWYFLLQIDRPEAYTALTPPEVFTEATVNHFIDVNMAPYSTGRSGTISAEMSDEICQRLTLALSGYAVPLKPFEIEGMPLDVAISFVKKRLSQHLATKYAAYRANSESLGVTTTNLEKTLQDLRASFSEIDPTATGIVRFLSPPFPDLVGLNVTVHTAPGGVTELTAVRPGQAGSAGPAELKIWEKVQLYANLAQFTRFGTPLEVAREALRREWASYLDEASRKASVLSHQHLPPLDHYRLLREETTKLIDKTEAQLSARILRFLLRCDEPWTFNELFQLRANAVSTPDDAEPKRQRLAGAANPVRVRAEQATSPVGEIVANFLSAHGGELCTEPRDRHAAEALLEEFLREFPLPTLRTPQKIAAAIQSWQNQEDAHYTRARRRWRAKTLKKFLKFLQQQRLIGEMPSFHHMAGAFWRSTASNLKQWRVGAIIAAMVVGLAGVWLLSHVHFGSNMTLASESLRVIDLVAFGGLLSSGSLIAPAIGSLILVPALLTALFPKISMEDHLLNLGLPMGLALTAAIAVVIALQNMSGFSMLTMLSGTMFVLVNIALFIVFRNAIVLAVTQCGVSFIFGLLAVNSTIFLLALANSSGYPALIVAICIILITLIELRNSRLDFVLVGRARRTTDITTMHGDYLPLDIVVSPGRTTAAHVLAAACATSAIEFLDRNYNLPLLPHIGIGVGIYAVVAGAIMYRAIARRTNVSVWQAYLVDDRAELEGPDPLELLLARGRRKLLWGDLTFLALCLLVVAGCESYFGLWPTDWTHPVTPLLVAGVVLLNDTATVFAKQLVRFVLNRSALPVQPVENLFDDTSDKEPGLLPALRRFLESKLVTIISFLVLLPKIFEFLDNFWELIRSHAHFWPW